ncbi:MAG: SRPBCC family protein [Thermoleophilaceae bacterium]
MASARRQVMVDAPVQAVWQLIGDVNRHPEWWPRVEAVECDLLDVGCTYRQVTKTPGKTIETTMSVESLDDCHELRVRCINTGMYAAFVLAEAQSGTFVDAELGIEPHGPAKLVGGIFVRRWLEQSLQGLKHAASAGGVNEQPGQEGRQGATA